MTCLCCWKNAAPAELATCRDCAEKIALGIIGDEAGDMVHLEAHERLERGECLKCGRK